jgi:hypothetical protein
MFKRGINKLDGILFEQIKNYLIKIRELTKI